jgi:two-component system, chemotaxis family, chemotaxis protein CheY
MNARVLVVDDSKLARRNLRQILEPLGYEVVEAEDGMRALERYFLEKPDIVLLDLLMQGMHGFDVLRKLRELDPSARVVVASADIQTSSRQLAEDSGASGFVEKPFDPRQIASAIGEVLRGGKSWS